MKILIGLLFGVFLAINVRGQDKNTIPFYQRLGTLWNVSLRWTPLPKQDDSTGVVYLQVIADDHFYSEHSEDVPVYASNYVTLFYSSIVRRQHTGFDSLYLDFSNISDSSTILYHYGVAFRDLDTMEITTPMRIKAFLFLCTGFFSSITEDKLMVTTFKYEGFISDQVHRMLNYRTLLIMYMLKNFIIDNTRNYKEFVFVWVDKKHNQLIEGYRPRSKAFRKAFKIMHSMRY